MRQTKAAVPIKPFKYFYGIGTPALPYGYFVALRSLSHYFLSSCFRSGSYLCPSPHFIHAACAADPCGILCSATITPRSLLSHCFISWLTTSIHTKPIHGGKHIPFCNTYAKILAGFHYHYTTYYIHFSRVQTTRCQ